MCSWSMSLLRVELVRVACKISCNRSGVHSLMAAMPTVKHGPRLSKLVSAAYNSNTSALMDRLKPACSIAVHVSRLAWQPSANEQAGFSRVQLEHFRLDGPIAEVFELYAAETS